MNERHTIVSREMGSLMVTVYSQNEPSDPDWDDHLEHLIRHYHRWGPSSRRLSWALGGVANASQRARLVRLMGPNRGRGAVLTSSPLVRGVMTALSWFSQDMRCFQPDHLCDALMFLQRDPQDAKRVKEVLLGLCRDLGLPSSKALEVRI